MLAFHNKKLLFRNDSRADLWRDTVAELQSNSANLSVAKDKPKEHRYKPQLPCFVACPDSIFALQASISVITTCLDSSFTSQASIFHLFCLPSYLFLLLRQASLLFFACLASSFCLSGKHSLSFSLALLPLFASQASIPFLSRLPNSSISLLGSRNCLKILPRLQKSYQAVVYLKPSLSPISKFTIQAVIYGRFSLS